MSPRRSRSSTPRHEGETEAAVEPASDGLESDELESDDEALTLAAADDADLRGAEVAEVIDAVDEVEPAEAPAALVATRASLVARDPLQAYINETRRYPLLSPTEEHELAVRFVESGDLAAARRLVTANLRLVVKIAHEYRKAYRNLLDLVQEGNIGLMHAVNKFDPYRGVKLSSYAAWWIRAYILKFILNNWRLVKIGTTQSQRKLFFNLRREVERLEALGVHNPGPRLLAQRLDVAEHEVQAMSQRLAGTDVSLDAPVRREDDGGAATTRMELMGDGAAGPDQQVENEQFAALLREKIRHFGSTLKGRDREIFDSRTVADEPLTLQEIGDRYGITRERARQIERRVMDRLRDYLRAELGDAIDVALGTHED